MPLRTINDAVYAYYDENGRYLTARRGETVEIPDGVDIERGDKFGAFTAVVGQEPLPPARTAIPDIEVDWSTEEFRRFVDAGHSNEILFKLSDVAEKDQAHVARLLIAAEDDRGAGKRQPLLDALAEVSAGKAVPLAVTVPDLAVGESLDDVAAFVEANGVDAIVARVKAEPELKPAVLAAEEETGKPRKSLTDALAKIEA